MEQSDSALQQYMLTFRRQAWLVVLVPVLVIAAMVAVVKTQDPIYRGSTAIVVGVQPSSGPENAELADFSTMRTMSALLENGGVMRRVLRRLRLDMSVEAFQERVKVDVLPETSVLNISYESTDARLARDAVRELASAFVQQVESTLEVNEPGRRPYNYDLNLFERPRVDPDPVGPNLGANLIFGAAAALALGLLLAVAREALDSRLRGRKEAEEWFGAPIVGTLPKGMNGRPPPGVASARKRAGDDRRTATLDLLRAKLQFAQTGVSGPTILVAGAGLDIGKSTVAANLGAALARGGKRVIVVDADVRRPRLHRSLGLDTQGKPGLVELLTGHVDLEEALLPVELAPQGTNGSGPGHAGSLELLPSGSAPAPPSELFTDDNVSLLIKQLTKRADYVVFDSPPLVAAESYPLAAQSDNVLVVARQGHTTKVQAEAAREMLGGLGVEKIGVVLTDAPPA